MNKKQQIYRKLCRLIDLEVDSELGVYMKKRTGKTVVSPNQMPLPLDVFTIETREGFIAAAGETVIDAAIRKLICMVLDRAFARRLTRERVADMMTEVLGRPINKTHLDQWAAPSQADKRIPADAMIVLMQVCEDISLLEWQAGLFSRRVLTEDEAICAEFGAMAVVERHIQAKQRNIKGQMDEKLLAQVMKRMGKADK